MTSGAPDDDTGMGLSSEPGGLLIIRTWTSPEGALRARIISTVDVSHRAQVMRSADSREEILDAVGEWLNEVATQGTEKRSR